MRALADALDPWESVGMLKTEYEIILHEQDQPRQPIACTTPVGQAGSGQVQVRLRHRSRTGRPTRGVPINPRNRRP